MYKVKFWLHRGVESDFLQHLAKGGHSVAPHGGMGRTLSFRDAGACHVHLWVCSTTAPLNTPEGLAVVAHEALHATLFALELIGAGIAVKPGDSSDEVVAYYLEWLVRRYLQIYL